jgi:ankyrin repeat protein
MHFNNIILHKMTFLSAMQQYILATTAILIIIAFAMYSYKWYSKRYHHSQQMINIANGSSKLSQGNELQFAKSMLYGDINTVDGADMNSILLIACKKGNTKLIKQILETTKHVNVHQCNKYGNSPLLYLCEHGLHDLCRILVIEYKANVNTINCEKMTPLLMATFKGHANIALLLIENGANVNVATNNNNTPLLFAVTRGLQDVAKELILRNADVNAVNDKNNTALILLFDSGLESLAPLLIKYGADVNANDLDDVTPLLWAVDRGNLNTARLLLENGSNVNAVTKSGFSSLHFACQHGYEEICKLLIRKGANVDLVDNDGHPALYYAAASGLMDICQLILTISTEIFKPGNNKINDIISIYGNNVNESLPENEPRNSDLYVLTKEQKVEQQIILCDKYRQEKIKRM